MNPKGFVIPQNEEMNAAISEEMVDLMKTMAKLGSLEKVVSHSHYSKSLQVSTAPAATLVSPVNAECNVSLDVKDLVDLKKEKAKLEKKYCEL